MVKIDENQEAIALIRMAIDNNDKAQMSLAQEFAEDCAVESPSDHLELCSQDLECHWRFGSRSNNWLDSRELEKISAPTNCDFIAFDERLRYFIVQNFPEEAPRYEDSIRVRIFSLPTSLKRVSDQSQTL